MSYVGLPSLQDVDKASCLIEHKIRKTPTQSSSIISQIATSNLRKPGIGNIQKTSLELFFKCENFQHTGSFKFRGASHFIARLQDSEISNGVVAYSTGNHAQAVACAAQLASQERNIFVPTYVVVPENCPSKKIDAAKAYGASVLLSGIAPEDRVDLATRIQASTRAILVPPADHLHIALGQATLIREFLQQVSSIGHGTLDAIIVPSGGGGLLVGAAAVCNPEGVTVYGAEPESGGPGLAAARQRGTRTTHLGPTPTIADGLRSLTGESNWEILKMRETVEDVFMASEQQIKEALRLAIEELGFVIEPSAAVPLAIALFNEEFQRRIAKKKRHVRIGIVLTGGNISQKELQAILPDLSMSMDYEGRM